MEDGLKETTQGGEKVRMPRLLQALQLKPTIYEAARGNRTESLRGETRTHVPPSAAHQLNWALGLRCYIT